MRAWVEKLAKASKERGSFYCMHITVDDVEWDIDQCFINSKENNWSLNIRHIKDGNAYQRCWIKLYDDEVDLLKEVIKHCENKARDYFLNKIESFN